MLRALLAITVLAGAPQSPHAALAGTWHLESYKRERLVAEPPGTATESLGATQRLNVTVAGDTVTIVMVVTDARMRGVGVTDRYDVDGEPHTYEWGDVVPREIGIRAASWSLDGFVVSDRGRLDSEPQEHRFTVSPDASILTHTITYPPPNAPA